MTRTRLDCAEEKSNNEEERTKEELVQKGNFIKNNPSRYGTDGRTDLMSFACVSAAAAAAVPPSSQKIGTDVTAASFNANVGSRMAVPIKHHITRTSGSFFVHSAQQN
jgi:hypothetical protein